VTISTLMKRSPSYPRRDPSPRRSSIRLDDHHLYQGAVQNADADLDFAVRVFKAEHDRPLDSIREDFCGTALLSATWAARGAKKSAIGIDLSRKTLDWARAVNLPAIGAAASRVTLLEANVLDVACDKVEAILALNFSYWVFKARATMRRYFEHARVGLRDGGIFVLDAFGGADSMGEGRDRRPIPAQKLPCGTLLPRYTYVWDQEHFNPVTHEYRCAIHFELPDGTKRRNAFRYDWRFWTLAELRELLLEAGFERTEVYVDGWDRKREESDGVYRRRVQFDHDPVWVAYVVGFTTK
jgi:cyclopropane fatty-acyl-phospholipid synthase-like methyltransferase